MKTAKNKTPREPKDVRYIRKLFAGAEGRTFQTEDAGFVPLPIVLRKLFRRLSTPEVRVLVYLMTRASKYGLCYPTFEEIAHDLGLGGRKNLTPHIKSLEAKRFLSTRNAEGKRFYLIHDPIVAIEQLAKSGDLTPDELDEMNDVWEMPNLQTTTMAELKSGKSKAGKKTK